MTTRNARVARSRIVANERLRDGFHLLRLEAPHLAETSTPGQFVLLRGLTPEWPYLKRPFSIYASDGDSIVEIVYKVVGRATGLMSKMADEDLEVLGPLGKGFEPRPGRTTVLGVAGGAGLPPVAFYCQRYVDVLDSVTLVVGARTVQELLLPVGVVARGVSLKPYTEDGSKGARGTAVDGLVEALSQVADVAGVQVVACGPREMLAKVARVASERGVVCDVSLEEMMACGLGACLGCAVPRLGGGYLHACQDGPVIDAAEVDWGRWPA
jgi:dihydroorotate dehydrogenase electron transfer subunit